MSEGVKAPFRFDFEDEWRFQKVILFLAKRR